MGFINSRADSYIQYSNDLQISVYSYKTSVHRGLFVFPIPDPSNNAVTPRSALTEVLLGQALLFRQDILNGTAGIH